MDLVGSSAPLSAKLVKTNRLISCGETAHDNAKWAAGGHPIQHHSGATIALMRSDNGFKSRLTLRLVKAAIRPTRLFVKKRTRRKRAPGYRKKASAAFKRAREQFFGSQGAASPVRKIDPVTGDVIAVIKQT
jgi:hypothetical protein